MHKICGEKVTFASTFAMSSSSDAEIVTGFPLSTMGRYFRGDRLRPIYNGTDFVHNQFGTYAGPYAMTTIRTKFGQELTCRSSQPIYIGEGTLICANDVAIGMPLTPYKYPVIEGAPDSYISCSSFKPKDIYNYGMIIGLDVNKTPEDPNDVYEIPHSGLRSVLPPCRVSKNDNSNLVLKNNVVAHILDKPVSWRLELLAGILDVSMNLLGGQAACIQMRRVNILYFIQELLVSLGCPCQIIKAKPVSTLTLRLCDFLKLVKLGLPAKYFKVDSVANPVDMPPIQDVVASVEHTYIVNAELITFEKSQKAVINGFLVQL